ncbi:response regulator transcription factor [Streptomyces sp. NBC_01304]|uniref:response regulator transcription factor n=1 Tax=Streptomyces sp. NBC_01304 TaxID=2903818 RepID=UPI002E12E319|nr:response regulator transcription factor [Streptomyces sp. NBC_01304]
MIRVLLVHEARLLRSALAERLAGEEDLEAHHACWRSAPGRARALRPDVCVADLDCSDSYGIAPLGELPYRFPDAGECRLLVIASASRPGLLRRAAEAHALGYIDVDSSPEELIHGIRTVAKGQAFIDESLGFGFLKAAKMPLTQRELSVLSLAAQGASVAEIAGSLHLSHGTVRNYMAAITRKIGARNRVDAIRISQGEGWL